MGILDIHIYTLPASITSDIQMARVKYGASKGIKNVHFSIFIGAAKERALPCPKMCK
jgi:hypothetical protein